MDDHLEIERKFLVTGSGWRDGATRRVIRQGYIATSATTSVRVRQRDDQGFLTVKIDLSELVRREFEYEIPVADTILLLRESCQRPPIEKVRHDLRFRGMLWEIDEFGGANDGLIVAEVELDAPDQEFARPDWLGPEVSSEPRFRNSRLAERPFREWDISYAELLDSYGSRPRSVP